MRYAILMTDVEGEWDGLSERQQQAVLDQHVVFRRALEEAGCFVDVLHLHPRSTARTVRRERDDSVTVSDGPFSDAPEYVGGLYVIEADSLDDAVEWAKKGRFMVGANEVRAIHI
jgi:hypothetical protein